MTTIDLILFTLFGWLGASLASQGIDTGLLILVSFSVVLLLAHAYLQFKLSRSFVHRALGIFFLMFTLSLHSSASHQASGSFFHTWQSVEANLDPQQLTPQSDSSLLVLAKLSQVRDLQGLVHPEMEGSSVKISFKKSLVQEIDEESLWKGTRWCGKLKMSASGKTRFKPAYFLGASEPTNRHFLIKKHSSWIHTKWQKHVLNIEKEHKSFSTSLGSKLMVSMLGAGYCGPKVDFLLTRFGLKHLTAISGLHFSILMVALFLLFMPFPVPVRLTLVVLGASAFLLATGLSASSARAWLMAIIGCYCIWQGREYDAIKALCLSALFWLFLFPQWSLSPGFILSYLCAFFLVLLSNWEKLSPSQGMLQKAFTAVAWQTALFLASAPLLLYWFHSISWLSIPANLLISPLFAFAFLLAAFACLFSWFSPLSGLLWNLASLFSQKSLDLLDSISLGLDQTIYYSLSEFELSILVIAVATTALFFVQQTFSKHPLNELQ